MKDASRRRLTLELGPKSLDRLDELCTQTDASKTDVVKRSLALYELVNQHMRAGGSVLLEHPEGEPTRLTFLES